MPMILVSGPFLIIVASLLIALLKARKIIHALRESLDLANQRQVSNEKELSQRFELDGLKDEFVSTVSHELRTPLTSIRGALGLLSTGVMGEFDPRAQNLVRIALTNTERLIRLINDILDLERMDSGRTPIQVRRCSLTDLINQAIETMNPMADASEVQLNIASSARIVLPSIYFDGDPDRILQVLTNLLSNAIKFSPPTSAVTIEVETPPDALIFRIADQGRGIPEDQLEAIFERFKQVEDSDARPGGGTGLGLAICRSIIHQHGGIIWAQQNPVKGVSICVQLPRQQRTYDHPLPLPNIPQIEAGHDSAVLICDDDVTHRTLIASQLRGRGHAVLEAASGEEAIEIASERPVHNPLQAILLDLHMSDMKGWELLKVLKNHPATTNLPIVVLSVQRPEDSATESTWSVASPLSEDHLFADLGRAIESGHGPSRILLVEDDADLASVVMGGFEKTDVEVDHAPTLQSAIALCQERRPDLVILDLTLPDGDGFSLVEWLRGIAGLRSLPLIVYSGREVSGEERSKLRLGPTRFLTKAKVQTQDVEQLVISMVDSGKSARTDHAGSEAVAALSPRAQGNTGSNSNSARVN